MTTSYLNFRVTETEKHKIHQKYQGKNLSEIIRNFLLENQAEPRQVRKA